MPTFASCSTERYNADVAGQVRILYGGSMKPGNAAELMAKPNVDGGLIGGAAPEGRGLYRHRRRGGGLEHGCSRGLDIQF